MTSAVAAASAIRERLWTAPSCTISPSATHRDQEVLRFDARRVVAGGVETPHQILECLEELLPAALRFEHSPRHHERAELAPVLAHDIFDGLDRGLAARRSGLLPSDQVVDVQFTEFMRDPVGLIAKLYQQLGLHLSSEAEARMRMFLVANPGDGGGGGTRYRWADTGLDADALRERAREYQDHFDVPSEPVT